jgi:hypothetical protein
LTGDQKQKKAEEKQVNRTDGGPRLLMRKNTATLQQMRDARMEI